MAKELTRKCDGISEDVITRDNVTKLLRYFEQQIRLRDYTLPDRYFIKQKLII